MIIKPYSDDYLFFNEPTGQYELTEKAVLDRLGINLAESVKKNGGSFAEILKRVSLLTYRKIHEHSNDDAMRDYIIATTSTGRTLIFEAMLEQFFYMKQVGDLSLSVDKERRALYFSDTAYEILETNIPEIGHSILYAGVC